MDAEHNGPAGARRGRASWLRRKRPVSKLVVSMLLAFVCGSLYISSSQTSFISTEGSWRPSVPDFFSSQSSQVASQSSQVASQSGQGASHGSEADSHAGDVDAENPLEQVEAQRPPPLLDESTPLLSDSSSPDLGEVDPEKLNPEKLNPEKLNPEKLNPEKLSPEKLNPDELNAGWSDSIASPSTARQSWGPGSSYNSCDSVTAETITKLQASTEPAVLVISDSKEVSEKLQAPAAICVLFAIPQTILPPDNYTDAPTAGRGPDTIHFYLNATDIIVTFPPLSLAPHQPDASKLKPETEISIVYAADTVLYTAGEYKIVAEKEFDHWFWAQEWEVTGNVLVDGIYQPTINTTTGVPGNFSYDSHKSQHFELPGGTISVSGPTDLPARPLCNDTLNAGVGRWYKQSAFPELSKEMTDEWGYTWQGDYCDLQYYTPEETIECLQDKTIQFFGDSMIRRTLKAVVSGGKWCYNLTDACQDADDGEEGLIDTLDYDADSGQFATHQMPRGMHFQHPDLSPIHFGRNSTTFFSFVTQVANWPGFWMDRLYDAADLIRLKEPFGEPNDFFTDRAIKEGMLDHARPPPESGEVDLVVLGFGAWDQAFTNRFDDYERELWQFKDAFLAAYGKNGRETPMIMRMANSWCCRPTENSFRRYTGSRIREFDSRTKKVFDYKDGGDALNGRVMVVDPINMNGRPDVLRDYPPSTANHPRASHVRMEAQMLMNSICKKESGGVSFRRTA